MNEYPFYQHGTRIRVSYLPERLDPVVLLEPNRKGIRMFGPVSKGGGRYLARIAEIYNAFTFLELLSILHRKYSDHIFVPNKAFFQLANILSE